MFLLVGVMIEFQIEIEKLLHKNQLFPRILSEFENAEGFDFEAHMEEHEIQKDFGFALLVQACLHKRAHITVMVGILRKYFDGKSQATADEIQKAIQAGLVLWNSSTRQVIVRFDISADVQAELDRFQFPLPMVVEPKKLTNNHDTGYLTNRGSAILKDNHHDDDICLDHLNKVNKIKLRINQQVALTIKNSWKGLDKKKPDEEYEDYQRRVKAFDKYDRTAHDVLDHLGLANEGDFYLTHKYDKRGRTYCQGYHVNYQGNPWNKSMIEFANQEVVT